MTSDSGKQGAGATYLSVVAPMYNEEANVVTLVEQLHAALDGELESYEILLVNDGSSDGTKEVAGRAAERDPRVRLVSYDTNGGRGKALRRGFAAARGQLIVSIDADLSYAPEVIVELVRALEQDPEADLVLASPYMPGGRTEGVPPLRLLSSRLGNAVLSAAMPGKIHTITCIVRGYRREVLEHLGLEADGKEIHLEILSKALAAGYRAKEVPAVLRGRQRGKSKFRLRATALSHLAFTFLQKPILLFGVVGLVLTLLGLAGGIYIIVLWQRQALNPDRPLMTLMVLLVLTGIQALSFGFVATQLVLLRKEVFKAQLENRQIKRKLTDLAGPPPEQRE